jgi:hypothetical protein
MPNDKLLSQLADILDCGEDEVLDTAVAVSNELYRAGQEAARWAPVLRNVAQLYEMWCAGEYLPIGPELELVVSYDLAQKRVAEASDVER